MDELSYEDLRALAYEEEWREAKLEEMFKEKATSGVEWKPNQITTEVAKYEGFN